MTRVFAHPRFLAAYSGILTLTFVATLAFAVSRGAFSPRAVLADTTPSHPSFDQITVHRINVVRADGTPRLVIAADGYFPGTVFKSVEGKRSNRADAAGMLFMDNEGTENGGLLFGGYQDKAGKAYSWGHLSFDEYEQDQALSLDSDQGDRGRRAGYQVWDNGTARITPEVLEAYEHASQLPHDTPEQIAAGQKAFDALLAKYPIREVPRAWLGRDRDKSAILRLADPQGQDRILLRVAPDGAPTMQFLDAQGKVISEWPQK